MSNLGACGDCYILCGNSCCYVGGEGCPTKSANQCVQGVCQGCPSGQIDCNGTCCTQEECCAKNQCNLGQNNRCCESSGTWVDNGTCCKDGSCPSPNVCMGGICCASNQVNVNGGCCNYNCNGSCCNTPCCEDGNCGHTCCNGKACLGTCCGGSQCCPEGLQCAPDGSAACGKYCGDQTTFCPTIPGVASTFCCDQGDSGFTCCGDNCVCYERQCACS